MEEMKKCPYCGELVKSEAKNVNIAENGCKNSRIITPAEKLSLLWRSKILSVRRYCIFVQRKFRNNLQKNWMPVISFDNVYYSKVN